MKRLYSMTHVGIVACPTDINAPVLSGCVYMTAELVAGGVLCHGVGAAHGTLDQLSGYICVELVTGTVAK